MPDLHEVCLLTTEIATRLMTAADHPAFTALLAVPWPDSNGYHSSVAERWGAAWPDILAEFEALLVVETSQGVAGYAGIQRHDIAYTGGMQRGLADHFLAGELEATEAMAALVLGLSAWCREQGLERLTLNMEPHEVELFAVLRSMGSFPERVAMFTAEFPNEPFDPTVRLMRPDERALVVEQGARIASALSAYPGSLVTFAFETFVELTERAYREYGATRPHAFFVAERDGRVVGFLFAVREGLDGGLIYDLYVEPEYRRQGISRSLYRRACAWLYDEGARWLTLSVYAENQPAYAAYAKWGFFPYFVAWEVNLRG